MIAIRTKPRVTIESGAIETITHFELLLQSENYLATIADTTGTTGN